MSQKKTSKSWYVKIKNTAGEEREERVTGVTTPEDAMALVTPPEGDVVLSARPVRVFKTQVPDAQT